MSLAEVGAQAGTVSYCAVTPPDRFNFRQPETWMTWKTRFGRFRSISGLSLREDQSQIDALLYTMGEGAEDIFSSLKLTDAERTSYATVIAKFDSYFLPKKNIIFERAQFNRRRQESHETVDAFVTDLHRLAESCQFGPLREELIRDRLVVGLLDAKLSESLQLDSELTMDTAISKARSSESIKKQQSTLRESSNEKNSSVDALRTSSRGNMPNRRPQRKAATPDRRFTGKQKPRDFRQPNNGPSSSCNWCGNAQSHSRSTCPARDKICSLCKKNGHFARVCRSGTPASQQSVPRQSAILEEVYVGAICQQSANEPWLIDVDVADSTLPFKIDTGADVTVISDKDYDESHFGPLHPTDKILLAPARQRLQTLGFFDAQLKAHGRFSNQRVYVVHNLQQCLLGRPAIKALGVLAALQEVSSDLLETPLDPKEQFPKLFAGLGCLGDEYAYQICLLPDAKPYAVSVPRRIPIPLLPKVKTELERMEGLGVIQRVTEATEWCAPMVIAWKRDGQIRICSSFEELNKQIIRERTVMPTVDESLGVLAGAKVFSKIDGRWGFWQIPLAKESQMLTTFITPFGRYMYQRLPFGISSAPEHFQRVMLQLLEGLPGQVCQLDDVLIHGRDNSHHHQHLQPVLERLQASGLTLNAEKCIFYKTEVSFLGHVLNSEGISADPNKTRAVQEMSPPTNVSELRSFLGMVNHLAKFVPDLSSKTKELRDLLRSDSGWIWDAPQQKAFSLIKCELTQPPVLALYDPSRMHVVSADASSHGLGGVLLQVEPDGTRRPVAYASRSLSDTEVRYAQVEKEALASTWACNRFRTYLVGLHFTIETDHKPLVVILGSKRLDDLTPRLQRFRLKLMEFSYDVNYVPGKEMFTSDVLSRSPLQYPDSEDRDLQDAVDEFELLAIELLPCSDKRLTQVSSAQLLDPSIARVREFCQSGWPDVATLPRDLKPYAEVASELTVVRGVLLRGTRLVIPPALREEMLQTLHEGHQGTTRTRARAAQSVWWPGVSSQIAEYVKNCSTCCKMRRASSEPLLSTPLPDRPWQMIGTDLFELDRQVYLVVVDYFSRFFELEKLKTTTSNAVIKKLKFMFARHGIPETLRSDNGPQYSSDTFANFCNEFGIKHATSSPLYPQSNGEAERTVQTAKMILRKEEDLAKGLLAHRSTPGACGPSPAELLYGRRLRTTLPTWTKRLKPKWPNLHKYRLADQAEKRRQAANYNSRHRVCEKPAIVPGTGVWIKVPTLRTGRVLQSADEPRSYVVETDTGVIRRTRRHLEPLVSNATSDPVVPFTPGPVAEVDHSSPPSVPSVLVTRKGRTSRPPKRLNL